MCHDGGVIDQKGIHSALLGFPSRRQQKRNDMVCFGIPLAAIPPGFPSLDASAL